jgi:hypothetical protein
MFDISYTLSDPLRVPIYFKSSYEKPTEEIRKQIDLLIRSQLPIIENKFTNDEYLVLDVDNEEIIGIKSESKFNEGAGEFLCGKPIGEIAILKHIFQKENKYKETKKFNLGTVSELKEFYQIKKRD